MKLRTAVAWFAASVALVTFSPAVAQAQNNDAPSLPKVIRIYREEVKQGKDAAHEKTEASFARMFGKYKYPAYSLGLTMVAGPTEAWFVEGHDSFKSIQDVTALVDKNPAMKAEMGTLDALDGELRANSRIIVATLQQSLVYRGEEFMKELPKTRYFMVEMMRVRPFMDGRFSDIGKQMVAANAAAGVEESVATYRVVAGAPGGTYLLFIPMKSLDFMDQTPERMKAVMEKTGMEKMAAIYKGAGEIILSGETFLMAINPKMSYVSKELASQDPDFWMPKAPAAVKPAAKPADKTTGAGQ